MNDSHGSPLGILAHQSLRRSLTAAERRLGDTLVEIFATGDHDFASVAATLQRQQVPRPSGSTEPWSVAALEAELKAINDSLDAAYERGPGQGTGG